MAAVGTCRTGHEKVDHGEEGIERGDRKSDMDDLQGVLAFQAGEETESSEERIAYFQLIDEQGADHRLREPRRPGCPVRSQAEAENEERIENHVEQQPDATDIKWGLA